MFSKIKLSSRINSINKETHANKFNRFLMLCSYGVGYIELILIIGVPFCNKNK